MKREMWLMGAGTVGCLFVGVGSFFLFRQKVAEVPAGGEGPAVATQGGDAGSGAGAGGGSAAGGGGMAAAAFVAPYRANTIAKMPVPADGATAELLRPTLIDVDVDQVDPVEAMQKIGDAALLPLGTVPQRRDIPPEKVTLHLKAQPLLEALLELESQSWLTLRTGPGRGATAGETALLGQYGNARTLPGIWSLAGPFAFVMTSIGHRVTLDREGKAVKVNVGLAQNVDDPVTVEISARFEPKLQVLQYPRAVDLIEAVDDRGHSLVAPRPPGVLTAPTNVNFALQTILAYPKENAGRKIKVLRGTAEYTIRLAVEKVEITDPMHAEPSTKTLNGMEVVFGRCTWNEGNQTIEFPVTYRRGAFKGDWGVEAQGLSAVRPVVTGDRTMMVNPSGSATTAGDEVNAKYVVRVSNVAPRGGGNLPPGQPVVERITLEVPLGTAVVSVPVEFHDIPLP